MLPFDLEAAKRGEPIVTRDGREAKFIAHVPESLAESTRILVLISGTVCSFYENGATQTNYKGEEQPSDLFMAPKKKTLWGYVFDVDGAYSICHSPKDTEQDAKEHCTICDRKLVKTFPVEVEE